MGRLIGFTGSRRTGKDTLVDEMVSKGDFIRVSFGDIIKYHFDKDITKILGFSAFTELDDEKEIIRPLLVHGGNVFYDHFSEKFFSYVDRLISLDYNIVNNRIFRVEEADRWKERGGEVYLITNSRAPEPETTEALHILEFVRSGIVDQVFSNEGTLDEWKAVAQQWLK